MQSHPCPEGPKTRQLYYLYRRAVDARRRHQKARHTQTNSSLLEALRRQKLTLNLVRRVASSAVRLSISVLMSRSCRSLSVCSTYNKTQLPSETLIARYEGSNLKVGVYGQIQPNTPRVADLTQNSVVDAAYRGPRQCTDANSRLPSEPTTLLGINDSNNDIVRTALTTLNSSFHTPCSARLFLSLSPC